MKMMVLLEGEGKERKVEEKVRKGGKGGGGAECKWKHASRRVK